MHSMQRTYKPNLVHLQRTEIGINFMVQKNLSMSLAGEIGELLEIFQWLTESASQRESLNDETLQAISEELADIQIYTLRLADKLNIDLETAVGSKMEKNGLRYSVEKSKGNAIKC